jgi:LysR family transcriptional regulator, low CO2-responsive transcriptional regulator
VVNNLAKTLSPAAEALRYFVLEQGEAQLAAAFGGDAMQPPRLRAKR